MNTLHPAPPVLDPPQSLDGEAISPAVETAREMRSALDAVIDDVEQFIRHQQFPVSTWRVQFNQHCTLGELQPYIGYLHTLGISDLYASPFLQARPGSMHGYDVVDHHAINSEIGTLDELRSLSAALREHGMGLIADVVPNHMAAAPERNAWWFDVLENGPGSTFASYFDIDWMPLKPDLAHKILLPVLANQFGKVLEDGQLQARFAEGSFWLHYYEHRYPLAPCSYHLLLTPHLDELRLQLGEEDSVLQELLSIITSIRNLPAQTETDTERVTERRREKEVIKRRLQNLVQQSETLVAHIERNLQFINGERGDPRSFDRLDDLLQHQAYRLSYWRVATDEINYRRFFDVNELAAICTENPQVFAESHALLFSLLDEGSLTGLRIDHPDGLYDPRDYLFQLQESHYLRLCRRSLAQLRLREPSLFSTGDENSPFNEQHFEQRLVELWRAATEITGSPLARPLYLLVEKILADGESLPEDWPVAGTVGYEYLVALNGLFVDPEGERPFTRLHEKFTGSKTDFEEIVYQSKRLIVRMSMASELNVLGHRLDRISERNRWTRDFTLTSLTRTLQEVVASFQVYRSYVAHGRVQEREHRFIENAVQRARQRNPAMDATVFEFVRDLLLLAYGGNADEQEQLAVQSFVGKFQQLTGPITAKAVEDTAFYRFNRLISLNEVGGNPARFGKKGSEFHQLNRIRARQYPHGLAATSTHDTKRSEDVRARISVLSEIPRLWRERVQAWSRQNRPLRTANQGIESPHRSAEYLLYQTLVGTWPDAFPTGDLKSAYVERLQSYMVKVIREAKVNTSWISPNEAYEAGVASFVRGLFDDRRRQPFLADMHSFASAVAIHGRWNALAQVLLKIASPGAADFYQGTELWHLVLVDPDNRRPVDLARHGQLLDELLDNMRRMLGSEDDDVVETWLTGMHDDAMIQRAGEFAGSLVADCRDGRIKLWMTLLGLRLRRRWRELFTSGNYEPLKIAGEHADRLIAFSRTAGDKTAIAIAPRFTVGMCGFGGPPPLGALWSDTRIELPADLADRPLRDLFTLRPAGCSAVLAIREVLEKFPAALLISDPTYR